MKSIRFDYRYDKMPYEQKYRTILCLVTKVHYKDLPEQFIQYDAAYENGREEVLSHYELPKTDLLVLTLLTNTFLWTTCRKWSKEKEEMYRKEIGKELKLIIKRGR